MSLLDVVKKQKENMNANNTLPLGDYTAHLESIKHDVRGDYDVYDFAFRTKDGHKLVDTMFVNSDSEKNENKIGYRVNQYYDAGLITSEALVKAMDNLDGFFDYVVQQVSQKELTVKLTEDTNNGKTYRHVTLKSVNIPEDENEAF
ncbi:hypothetical protein [Lactobacillus acetotolerans]|uniref:hypothetical protein n=1 Tax=Lactobacillus acetotolerans TaxID=1600 RepID=UPI002FD8D1A2